MSSVPPGMMRLIAFEPERRGPNLAACSARFSLTCNEHFINARRRAGDDAALIAEMEQEQEQLCAHYACSFLSKVTRTIVPDDSKTEPNPPQI